MRAVESEHARPGESYSQSIERPAADPYGRLHKFADSARSLESNDELLRTDPETAARLRERYERAREWILGSA